MPPRRVIGVDAGGTKLLGGVVDERLLVHHRVYRLWAGADRTEVLDTVVEAVEEARQVAPEADSVGFGIPSLVDFSSGTSLSSVHLPLAGIPFRDLLSERLGMPVAVDNDANVALLAEHRLGAARGTANAAMLTIGTGIGGAVLLDGRLYRGATGAAGELGHMVVDMNGPACQGNCPNRGCLEAMASGRAIGREGVLAAEAEPESQLGQALAGGREITGALVTDLAHAGDPPALAVLDLIGQRLGVGIANIANIFNPEVVVIGGGAIRAGDLLLEPARRVLAERALPPSRDVPVVAAAFGEEAGMLGAGLMALDSFGANGASATEDHGLGS
jgi:glucokinase